MKDRIENWKKGLPAGSFTINDVDELCQHLEDKTKELMARGFTEDEAWAVAAHELGDQRELGREFKKVNKPASGGFLWGFMGFLALQLVAYTFIRLSEIFHFGSASILNIYSNAYVVIILVMTLAISAYLWRDAHTNIQSSLKALFVYKGLPFYGKLLAGSVTALFICLVCGFITMNNSACENANPVFERFAPQSEPYKKELVRELTRLGTDNLLYTFGSYREINGKYHLLVAVKGRNLCANIWMDVNDPAILENIKRVKGRSYAGAELQNLRMDIVHDNTGTHFIYKGEKHIID